MDNTLLCWGFSDEEWLVFLLHCWRGSFTCLCYNLTAPPVKNVHFDIRDKCFSSETWQRGIHKYLQWKIFNIWAITSKPRAYLSICPVYIQISCLEALSSASFYRSIHRPSSAQVQTTWVWPCFYQHYSLREPPHCHLCLPSSPVWPHSITGITMTFLHLFQTACTYSLWKYSDHFNLRHLWIESCFFFFF